MATLPLGRWVGAAGAATLLATHVVLAGQPDGTGSDADTAAYYAHHALSVWAGNGLWLAGTALLLVAVWRMTTSGASEALGVVVHDLSAVAAALMVAAGLSSMALTIVAQTSGEAATGRLWDIESNLFVLAAWTWMAVLAVTALYLRDVRVSVAAAAVAVAALGVFDLDAAWPMFLLWVAVGAALAPAPATRLASRPVTAAHR